MGWAAAAAAIAGGIVGGIAGGSDSPGESTRVDQGTDINLKDIKKLNVGRSELEASATQSQQDLFSQLNQLVSGGPGQSDVQAGMAAQQGYGNLLQQQLSQGGLPSQDQIGAGQQYAQSIFAPQQVMLNQQFNQERINQQRLAARLGRRSNDPVLANKLAFSQGQLQQQLGAQQGAFAAQTAMSLPERQAMMAERLANVRGGLASQALQNRVSLLNMGSQLAAAERQYRINTAYKRTTQATDAWTPGSTAGAIGGALAGVGTGMKIGGMGGGGGASGGGNEVV